MIHRSHGKMSEQPLDRVHRIQIDQGIDSGNRLSNGNGRMLHRVRNTPQSQATVACGPLRIRGSGGARGSRSPRWPLAALAPAAFFLLTSRRLHHPMRSWQKTRLPVSSTTQAPLHCSLHAYYVAVAEDF